MCDIFNKIMELANKRIEISYDVINEVSEGNKQLKPTMSDFTYTIYVIDAVNVRDIIDCQNFDDLKLGLEWGIKKANDTLKMWEFQANK